MEMARLLPLRSRRSARLPISISRADVSYDTMQMEKGEPYAEISRVYVDVIRFCIVGRMLSVAPVAMRGWQQPLPYFSRSGAL